MLTIIALILLVILLFRAFFILYKHVESVLVAFYIRLKQNYTKVQNFEQMQNQKVSINKNDHKKQLIKTKRENIEQHTAKKLNDLKKVQVKEQRQRFDKDSKNGANGEKNDTNLQIKKSNTNNRESINKNKTSQVEGPINVQISNLDKQLKQMRDKLLLGQFEQQNLRKELNECHLQINELKNDLTISKHECLQFFEENKILRQKLKNFNDNQYSNQNSAQLKQNNKPIQEVNSIKDTKQYARLQAQQRNRKELQNSLIQKDQLNAILNEKLKVISQELANANKRAEQNQKKLLIKLDIETKIYEQKIQQLIQQLNQADIQYESLVKNTEIINEKIEIKQNQPFENQPIVINHYVVEDTQEQKISQLQLQIQQLHQEIKSHELNQKALVIKYQDTIQKLRNNHKFQKVLNEQKIEEYQHRIDILTKQLGEQQVKNKQKQKLVRQQLTQLQQQYLNLLKECQGKQGEMQEQKKYYLGLIQEMKNRQEQIERRGKQDITQMRYRENEIIKIGYQEMIVNLNQEIKNKQDEVKQLASVLNEKDVLVCNLQKNIEEYKSQIETHAQSQIELKNKIKIFEKSLRQSRNLDFSKRQEDQNKSTKSQIYEVSPTFRKFQNREENQNNLILNNRYNYSSNKNQIYSQIDQKSEAFGRNSNYSSSVFVNEPFLIDCVLINEKQKLFIFEQVKKLKKINAKKSKMLYKFDRLNPQNPHQYIDNVPNIFLVIQLANNKVVGAYTQNAFVKEQKDIPNKAILIDFTNQKLYPCKPKERNTIMYDEGALIWGRNQLLIKMQEPTILYSNFTANHTVYWNVSSDQDQFLGQKKLFEKINRYEIHRIYFG